MHDPKIAWGDRAATYWMDATPGRHTANFGPGGFPNHLVNITGCVCLVSTVCLGLRMANGWLACSTR